MDIKRTIYFIIDKLGYLIILKCIIIIKNLFSINKDFLPNKDYFE